MMFFCEVLSFCSGSLPEFVYHPLGPVSLSGMKTATLCIYEYVGFLLLTLPHVPSLEVTEA